LSWGLAVLNFLSILASIVLNLFLIYNPKYCYASLLNKLYEYEVFVYAVTREKAWSKMHFTISAALAAVLFTTLIENLRFCSSAEAGIVALRWVYTERDRDRGLRQWSK